MWALHVSGVVGAVVSMVAGGALAAPGYSQGRQFYGNLGNSLASGTTGNTNNAYSNSNTYSNNNVINNNGHNSNNNVYSANSLGYNTGSSQQALQNYYSSAAQYPDTAGYYGFYAASSDNSQDTYTYVPASSYGTGTVTTHDSSPALSALALLGFLYFLNLIQDVLRGNNSGRRRRALSGAGKDVRGIEEDEEGHYITSYIEGEPVNEGNGIEGEAKEEGEKAEVRTTGHSWGEPRSFSFLEDFFIRLPDILGIRKWQMIDRVSSDKTSMGMGAFFSSRVKMISSIMSFLQNPSPARIRRELEQVTESEEESVTGKGKSESFLIPSPESIVPLLIEVLKGYLPFKSWAPGEGRASSRGYGIDFPVLMEAAKETKEGDEEVEEKEEAEEESSSLSKQGRHRRHSPTSMNAWYSELGGRNKDADGGLGGVAAKAISILGGGDETQQAVKQEAAPALLELSQGMISSQPHCLQRVLCRLTSHAKQLSLISRVALQMFSTNLSGGSEEAVKAGLRGENCSQTFSECDTGSKLGKT